MASVLRSAPRRVACLFLALTVVATYPIATAPASYTYFGHSDVQLNMWIMAWDAHALRHDPVNLFNANIFSPERGTLSYSETLLGYLPIFGPVLWLRGSPVLAFNLVLFFSFAASGFGMYLLARHLTGREWSAIVAGIIYAFGPYRFGHVPQIQLLAMEWMPLALLSLHLFVERGRVTYAVGLGASVVLGTLCCVYYGIFLAAALVIAMAGLYLLDRRARDARKLVILGLTGCIAAGLLVPFCAQYLRVHHRAGLERSIAEVSERSADLDSYFASGAAVHQALGMGSHILPHDYLFPGFFALLLAAMGLIERAHRRTVAVYAAILSCGLVLSVGPNGLIGWCYRVLYAAVPLLHGLRQASRFGVLVLFGLAVLAAFGCAALESRFTVGRGWKLAIGALAFLELLQAPLRYDRPGGVPLTRVPHTPAVYSWLAQQPGEFSILELPFPHVGQAWRNAEYVYWSTVHWHPLANGYSGFVAPDYSSLRRILNAFPDDLSRRALAARDVRYVVIHWARYSDTDYPLNVARLERTAWLRRVSQFPDTDVFEVERAFPLADPRGLPD